jgi:3-oxoadipate CoA-transferase, alpha subunit
VRGREGVARLIGEGRVRKIMCSFARSRGSVIFEEVFARGEIELEILPQGTMAERIRAGAAGIPAFYTATGAGTKLAQGKEARVFDGREYILEQAIRGDVALVEAWRADRWGNLVYRDAGRNFNPVMAAAAELTIVQTQHVAELGTLSPEEVATPGIYVDRVVHLDTGDPPLKTG